ncbi:MAG TPA: aminotransferase class I/II-fold pyridoxal phosphate-dependent enzyme [Terriglobales bacterium]|nr:aminotransferase class I/II-fold pyridoxal phosphate-dependent enzyme [Terriglobales bacterium]
MAKRGKREDDTLCVHAGEDRHGANGSITTDVVHSAVFVLDGVDELRRIAEHKSSAYMYTRYANPTTRAAEEKLAALEGAEDCVVTSSGMAATMCAVLAACKAGDEIVSMLDIYGGTLKMFENIFERFGVKTRFVPFQDLDRIERYFTKRTRMLFIETPTNPTLRCADIEKIAAIGRKRGACVVVDNTFATPILQKPLALGADMVIHSGTKYLGGHSDVTAGAVAGSKAWMDPVREMMKLSGGCLDPAASYLLIRGMKTLEIRVERAAGNATILAEVLREHPKVERVFFPGLPQNEGHEAARRQMKDFGMMVSFDIKGGGKAAERFIDRLQMWYLAPSLGGVESTVSYPVLSSHVGISKERLKLLGVSPATVRLSVGIEHAADLVEDVEQAFIG